jgi:branched-chain amino acid transport system ATP-binding protein
LSEIILHIKSLSKFFGGIRAIDDVSFDVQKGVVTAVIGPNGAGKTTLFNLVCGFHRPDRGRVELEDRDITALAPHRVAAAGIVRTFQLVRLFNDMSLSENVMVGGHLMTKGGLWTGLVRPGWYRQQQRELEQTAERQLSLVGLGLHAKERASNLTYGQKRRLEIARALAARPKLLLLDEPAAGLSAGETRELLTIIRSLTQEGISVMLIDHDMNLVMEIADRVVVLDFGKKICEGTPEIVRQDAQVCHSYLGKSERSSILRRRRRNIGVK